MKTFARRFLAAGAVAVVAVLGLVATTASAGWRPNPVRVSKARSL